LTGSEAGTASGITLSSVGFCSPVLTALSFLLTDASDPDFRLAVLGLPSPVALTIVVLAAIGSERFDLLFPNVIANEGLLCVLTLSFGGELASSLVVFDTIEGAILAAEEAFSRFVSAVEAAALRGHVRDSHDERSRP
jgi:hypothetical protein